MINANFDEQALPSNKQDTKGSEGQWRSVEVSEGQWRSVEVSEGQEKSLCSTTPASNVLKLLEPARAHKNGQLE